MKMGVHLFSFLPGKFSVKNISDCNMSQLKQLVPPPSLKAKFYIFITCSLT